MPVKDDIVHKVVDTFIKGVEAYRRLLAEHAMTPPSAAQGLADIVHFIVSPVRNIMQSKTPVAKVIKGALQHEELWNHLQSQKDLMRQLATESQYPKLDHLNSEIAGLDSMSELYANKVKYQAISRFM